MTDPDHPDLMLPDMDGLVLTTTLKALTDSPIIICSARHGQVDRALGLRLGAADFVAKPFDLDDLQGRTEAAGVAWEPPNDAATASVGQAAEASTLRDSAALGASGDNEQERHHPLPADQPAPEPTAHAPMF